MQRPIKLSTECSRTIIFADTDAGGMMYFGQAARFIETGIHDWFKKNNMKFINEAEPDLFWVIRELNVIYSKMITFDEEVNIVTSLKHIGRYSLSFSVSFFGTSDIEKVTSTAKLIPINLRSGICSMLPDQLFQLRSFVKPECKEKNNEN